MCRMRGQRFINEQDARGKLAQKFAHPHIDLRSSQQSALRGLEIRWSAF